MPLLVGHGYWSALRLLISAMEVSYNCEDPSETTPSFAGVDEKSPVEHSGSVALSTSDKYDLDGDLLLPWDVASQTVLRQGGWHRAD